MSTLLYILAGISFVTATLCWFTILVHAFRDSLLKGFLGLLCGLYLLYYALVEFKHELKWFLVLTWILGGFITAMFIHTARLA